MKWVIFLLIGSNLNRDGDQKMNVHLVSRVREYKIADRFQIRLSPVALMLDNRRLYARTN